MIFFSFIFPTFFFLTHFSFFYQTSCCPFFFFINCIAESWEEFVISVGSLYLTSMTMMMHGT
ncbi:hypothetical protein V8C35DRAFT_307215 [Trichoderma chlorosporum]